MAVQSIEEQTQFDYETKTWGGHDVKLAPTYLGAMRLKYCLEDLQNVQGKVLEVGCGAGGMARAIKAYRPDLQVFGCDVSRQALATARQQSREVVFDFGDAYDLPYDPGTFSAVVMFDVLEHLDEPGTSVAEINRVLQNKGTFHLFVPCEGELHALHGLLAKIGWRAKEIYGGHIQGFTLPDVKEILWSSGFQVPKTRWSAHLINQLADVAYFTLLSMKGSNTRSSVEGYLAETETSLFRSLVSGAKATIAMASFYESLLLAAFPGSGAHLIAVKSGKSEVANGGM